MQSGKLVGTELNSIILQEHLGRHPLAPVYRALDTRGNRVLAVHVVRINPRDEHMKTAFEQEVARLQMLDHVRIQPLRHSGIEKDHAYLAFDLKRGGTLADLLARKALLDFTQVSHLLSQVVQGLSYAHSQGVYHHDLHPASLVMDDSSNVFLSDFGLARKLYGDDLISSREGLVRPPSYLAPEQIRGEPLDARTDVYSLGVVLYRMITGRLPHHTEGDPLDVINRHVHDPPPPPKSINPDVPGNLQDLTLRAMAKDPAERFESVRAFGAALNDSMSQMYEALDVPKTQTAELEAIKIADTPSYGNDTEDRNLPDQLRTLILVGTVVFVVAALVMVAVLSRPPSVGTILAGETAQAEAISPAPPTVRNARLALGNNGSIAYIACNRTSEFHAGRTRDLSAMAEADRLPLRIYDSDSDASLEVANIQSALADGARGIILCLLNAETALPSLQEAREDSVFIVLDTSELQGRVDGVFAYTSNYDMGYRVGLAAGDFATTELDTVKVALLDFPDLQVIVERADGLEAGLLENAPEAEILGRWVGATQDNGEQSMRAILDEHPDVNMILSINDAGAYGAIDVLDAEGVDVQAVHIFSIDAEQIARSYIDDGTYMRGSLTVNRTGGARTLLDVMIKLLGGEAVPENILVPPGDVYTGETVADDAS